MLVENKAVSLIMLGDEAKANELLKKLYESQTDGDIKKMTLSLMDKSKKELLAQWTEDKYNH